MNYWAVAIIAVAYCVFGGLAGIAAGNVEHVRCGRPPNAGWSPFPVIPLVPLLFVGIAWLLDQVWPETGWKVVVAILGLATLFQ